MHINHLTSQKLFVARRIMKVYKSLLFLINIKDYLNLFP